MMKVYTLSSKQILSISKANCWEFFSNPSNLQKMTPPDLDFRIQSELSPKMYPGQIIVYRIRIFPMISVSWVTEITHVKEFEFFIDEQRFGPYKFWHHQHMFKEIDKGIEMTDLVHYAIPFGIFGRILHALIIKRRLKYIFKFRKEILDTDIKNNFYTDNSA